MSNEARVVTVRVYFQGVLLSEEEVSGPLSTKGAKAGKGKGK
jgi:hypothetical protein